MSMKKEDALLFAEECQIEADKLAYIVYENFKLSSIQDICSFNVFWMKSVSTMIFKQNVIDFLFDNKSFFKRKLSIDEFMRIDFIVANFLPENFTEMVNIYKNYNPRNFKLKIDNYENT